MFISSEQFLKHLQNIYRGIAGFDMSCYEFKRLCMEAWKDEDCIYI